jgi:hypothetical protein
MWVEGMSDAEDRYIPTNTPLGGLRPDDGRRSTGDAGGKVGTIVGTPEPLTSLMLLLGFAGPGFAGYRKAQSGWIAPSVA